MTKFYNCFTTDLQLILQLIGEKYGKIQKIARLTTTDKPPIRTK